MIPKIKGFLKEVKLVGLDSKSLGEAPHYFLQIIYPIQKEIYISDTRVNLINDMLIVLYKENILSSTNYNVIETDGGIIEITRKIDIL